MKKHIIAAAVAAAVAVPAMAQNVVITGRVGASLDTFTNKVGTVSTTQTSVGDPNSRVIFTVTEDLGAGLKFVGQLDVRGASDSPSQGGGTAAATTDSPVANFNGNTYASLVGNFGRILVGKHDMLYNETLGNSTSSDVLDGLNNHRRLLFTSKRDTTGAAAPTQITGGRVNNLVRFDTPTVGALNATFGYSTSPSSDEQVSNTAALGNDDNGSAVMAFLRYNEGALKATAGLYEEKRDTTAAAKPKDKFTLLAASYTSGPLEVGINWTRNEYSNGAGTELKTAGWQIPVNYAMGATTLHAAYAKMGEVDGTAATGAVQYMLGVTYNLSKRTLLGAGYSKLNNDAAASYKMLGSVTSAAVGSAAGADGTYYGVGIRHNF